MYGDEMTDIIISFLIAVLMGMGIGGGGFLVIYLTLCLNFEQIIAQGTNLAFFLLCGISAVFVHLIKRKISLRQVVLMSTFGSVGAYLFSRLANMVNPEIPRLSLGVLLVLSGLLSIVRLIKNKEK